MKKISLLIVLVIGFFLHGFSQNPGWTVFDTVNSGLPGNDVRSIVIDNNQNKWIASYGDGIAKFDGTDWIVYNVDNSGLPGDYVHSIAIDSNQNIWIGIHDTISGSLAKFDGTDWTVYDNGNSGFPGYNAMSIKIDQYDNKWIGTYSNGLVKFNNNDWTVYNAGNSGLPYNWVWSIAIDNDQNKWFGTYGYGLAKFDGSEWTVYNEDNSGLPYNYVVAISIDNNGNKWIGTLGGLAKFDGTDWTVYDTINSGLPDNQVMSIAIDNDQNKWIGTCGGLVKFDGTDWTVYDTGNSGLPGNIVSSIAIDNNQNKWIGTGYGGLALFGEEWMTSLKCLTGRAFADINENDVFDAGDCPLPDIMLQANPGPYYGITNNDGQYKIWVDTTEEHVVTSLLDSDLWHLSYPTDSSYSVPVSNEDTVSGLDFAYVADTYCPDMEVDIGLFPVVLCFNTSATVSYQNNGTLASDSTTITVELDDHFEYVSGGNLVSQSGNTLSFDVDTVLPGESGSFSITLETTCDLDFMGATACVEAHIYPDEPCVDPDPEWDHSSVAVEGECVGDSLICFSITNTGDPGDGDMSGPSEYRLYEDNIIVETGTFQLVGGETTEMCWTATGTTLRLEADQHPAHPGNSEPQASIELCGSPENSTGEILSVPQDDVDAFTEIDCQEIVSSYDPNDKSVVPQGVTENHYIDSTNILEYKIRFQNTGTAPAQKVVITDTISNHLDIETIQFMSESHPCDIDILYSNVIRWTFNDIMLPDSNSNEPASHGYVKFKIHQHPGNQISTEITNQAAIFFDYNPAVITNEVFNIIGDMEQIFTHDPEVNTQQQVDVFPNPAADYVLFNVDADKYSIELYDGYGRIIRHIQDITSAEYRMPASNISHGVYYYRIKDQSGVIGSGKLVITE